MAVQETLQFKTSLTFNLATSSLTSVDCHSSVCTISCNSLSAVMPFSNEDRIIIKHYRQTYNWGSVKILRNIGEGKNWTQRDIDFLLKKIDDTGTQERRKGSGRPPSARSDENKDEVEELIMSQENPETGEWERHESPRMIAQRLGVSKNTIYRIIKTDLDLTMFHRVKGQSLTEVDHEKRVVRSKRMLRYFTRHNFFLVTKVYLR